MKFDIKDRLTQGFISGLAGFPLQLVFMLIMHQLHLTKYHYADFAAVLTYNHRPEGLMETLFAEFVVLIFQGVLGIGFAFFLKAVSSANIFLKGWLYGTFVWFAIYAVMTIFQLKYIYPVDTLTAASNLIAASIWSFGTTWAILFLNRKYGVKD